MTSTKFNIGLSENRNSSRVLRPPGGGHTDIFGIRDLPQQKKVEAPEPVASKTVEEPEADHVSSEDVQPSSENPQTTNENVDSSTNGEKEAEENNVTDNSSPSKISVNGEEVTNSEADLKIAPAEEVKKEPEQPVVVPVQRKRVPPGGYSSGLW